MAQQSQLIGNEAHRRTLELLRGQLYTRAEVDALLAQVAGAVLTYDAQTRSVSGVLAYDAASRSVSGMSLTESTVHIIQ